MHKAAIFGLMTVTLAAFGFGAPGGRVLNCNNNDTFCRIGRKQLCVESNCV